MIAPLAAPRRVLGGALQALGAVSGLRGDYPAPAYSPHRGCHKPGAGLIPGGSIKSLEAPAASRWCPGEPTAPMVKPPAPSAPRSRQPASTIHSAEGCHREQVRARDEA